MEVDNDITTTKITDIRNKTNIQIEAERTKFFSLPNTSVNNKRIRKL